MPIDGHAYLVKQGWGGKGTGLRHGAIARPVTVTQKKTLSGVGKDRDEAFPFWDHVFEAAAMSIQVKISKDSDDDSSDSDAAPAPTLELKRTKTGMISHRQHKTGTSALSGAGTPDSPASGSVTPRLSVMAAAKQEAAKRMLYANFFRGPVLGPMAPDGSSSSKSPEAIIEAAPDPEAKESDSASKKKGKERAAEPSPNVQDHALEKVETADEDKTSKEKRRRKWENEAEEGERKEKKRRKRQAEQTSADEIGEKKRRRRDTEAGAEEGDEDRKAAKAERKRRKQEKHNAKEARRNRKQELKEAATVDEGDAGCGGDGGEGRANDTSDRPVCLAPEELPRKFRKRDKVSTGEEGEPQGEHKKRRKSSSC